MGPVVVVVVVVLVVFKTFTHISRRSEGPDFAYKTFFGVGSLKYQGIQPRRKFYTRSQHLCQTCLDLACVKTFFRVGSQGSNPEESFIREVRTCG